MGEGGLSACFFLGGGQIFFKGPNFFIGQRGAITIYKFSRNELLNMLRELSFLPGGLFFSFLGWSNGGGNIFSRGQRLGQNFFKGQRGGATII